MQTTITEDVFYGLYSAWVRVEMSTDPVPNLDTHNAAGKFLMDFKSRWLMPDTLYEARANAEASIHHPHAVS